MIIQEPWLGRCLVVARAFPSLIGTGWAAAMTISVYGERAMARLLRTRFSIAASIAVLVAVPAIAGPITVDGSIDPANRNAVGDLPWIYLGVWEGTGVDGYPLGEVTWQNDDFLVTPIALFDTGSTKVAVSEPTDLYLNNFDPTKTIEDSNPVEVRVNGLQDGAGPWGVSPINEGGPDEAGLVVSGVEVEVSSTIPSKVVPITYSPDFGVEVLPSLVGSPVTTQSIALLDYTSLSTATVNFGPDPGIGGNEVIAIFEGPEISFFDEGEAPAMELMFSLTRIPESSTTPENRKRYILDSVTFNNGSDSTSGSFFYDTGTTVTFINNVIAASLGITSATAQSFDCGFGMGVEIDSFVLSGPSGDYTVNNAQVCWTQTDGTFAGPFNALIGSNLFSQVPVLFDGINNTLSVGYAAENSPPVANAGEDQTVECTSTLGASVVLDGTGSYDPDSDTLSYLWTGVFGTETGPTPNVTVPLGANSVTLTVDDGNGASDTDSVEITVVDTTAPTVDAGPDVTLEATSPDGAPFDVSTQVTASDACGSVGLSESPVPASYPLGSTVVTVTATDGRGNSASDTMTVTVVDTMAPDLEVTVTPTILWPPNHDMVPIDWTYVVSDVADPSPLVDLVHVQSDEGDGVDTFDPAFDVTEFVSRKGGDIQLVDGQLFLRAERAGNSDGRVYTLTFQATDASGNSTTVTKTVVVPHNQ
jgi:hypothetical protein